MLKKEKAASTVKAQDDPIDVVVLWVDGNDPAWQKEKAKYQPQTITDANAANRFRDWGLMKYWFRAIENYVPWVRTIHFVTWGHTPDFLKLDHPKLHIVRHEDYLPKDCLPTFNACAIEMSIHKIEGLAEHFIFFNDDMFLLRPLSQICFFRKGLPVAKGSEEIRAPRGKPFVAKSLYQNDLGIINEHFPKRKAVKANRKKYINRKYGIKSNFRTFLLELLSKNLFVGLTYPHAPAAFRKKTFTELWEAEPELLRETTAHRFRDHTDLNQWAALWWQIASGQFSPGKVDNVLYFADPWMIDTICGTIRKQSHDMICINDPVALKDAETTAQKIRDAFETILPNKCSFEK